MKKLHTRYYVGTASKKASSNKKFKRMNMKIKMTQMIKMRERKNHSTKGIEHMISDQEEVNYGVRQQITAMKSPKITKNKKQSRLEPYAKQKTDGPQ